MRTNKMLGAHVCGNRSRIRGHRRWHRLSEWPSIKPESQALKHWLVWARSAGASICGSMGIRSSKQRGCGLRFRYRHRSGAPAHAPGRCSLCDWKIGAKTQEPNTMNHPPRAPIHRRLTVRCRGRSYVASLRPRLMGAPELGRYKYYWKLA